MALLVYVENLEGKFKKSSFETLTYGKHLADKLSTTVTALSIGKVEQAELDKLATYGATKILNTSSEKLAVFNNQAYAQVITAAAEKESADTVIILNTFSGKGLAPRVAVRMKAAIVSGAIELPDTSSGFVVKKTAYSSKAYAYVNMLSAKKVITLIPNSYKVEEAAQTAATEVFEPAVDENCFKTVVKEVKRNTDKVLLPDAEFVVSAGRGLKGPENWKMVEELADLLGAATACSKPVSDAGWRPHSEHVGQTGIAISPNLYIAIGISGAIQHLAGVSSSKVIVVINKDPEAPFFKAADYGIVGDAFEVVPKLIEEVKKLKAANA